MHETIDFCKNITMLATQIYLDMLQVICMNMQKN